MICLLVEHSHVNMNQSARLTWCVDDAALRVAVANSLFAGESLDETEAQEVTGVVECLLEDGIYHFEGDPPIQLIRGTTLIDDAMVDRALAAIWRPPFSGETKALMRAAFGEALNKETP